MSFQFSCPQGHVLQGEANQIGQLFQCPFCGESFAIPSPATPAHPQMGGDFMQGLPPWPGGPAPQGYPPPDAGYGPSTGFPGQGFPAQNFPSQGFPQQGFPNPGGQMPMNPMAGAAFPLPAQQPAPIQPKPEAPAEPEGSRPRFVLDFDPHAKAALPFDMPGGPNDKFSFDKPAEHLHDESGDISSGPLLSPLPIAAPLENTPSTDFTDLTDAPKKVQILHVRCPSGHALKVNRDQHGKPVRCSVCKQVFEVRYENSLEFQRRTEKVVSRAKAKEGQEWLAWALFAAFVVVAGLVALFIYANSR